MNFQRPKGRGRNQKDGRTMQFACTDFEGVHSDGDLQCPSCGKTAFIADYTLEHGLFVGLDLEKAIDNFLKKAKGWSIEH